MTRLKTSINTSFSEIDAITNSWSGGQLILISGCPAVGKTSLAVSLCHELSVMQKIPTAFFSIKDSKSQLSRRLVLLSLSMSNRRNDSAITFEEISKIVNKTYAAELLIDDTTAISIELLCNRIKKMVTQAVVRAVFINYLQLIVCDNPHKTQSKMEFISQKLASLAREIDIPIIVFGQLPGKTKIHDYVFPFSIQNYDTVALLYRPFYYHNDLANSMERLPSGLIEIYIKKHPHLSEKKFRLGFLDGRIVIPYSQVVPFSSYSI